MGYGDEDGDVTDDKCLVCYHDGDLQGTCVLVAYVR